MPARLREYAGWYSRVQVIVRLFLPVWGGGDFLPTIGQSGRFYYLQPIHFPLPELLARVYACTRIRAFIYSPHPLAS